MKSTFTVVLALLALPLFALSAHAYVTLCDSGCNFTSLDSAMSYLNGTSDSLVINGSGTYSLSLHDDYFVYASSSGSVDSASASISISSDNVVLNCNGSSIHGNNSDKGLYSGIGLRINSSDNITVRNCRFSNYTYGIFVRNSNGTLLLNTSSSYNRYGALDFTSSNATVTNSSFLHNRYGFDVYGSGSSFDASTRVTLINSVVSFSSVDGITAQYAYLWLKDISVYSNGASPGDSGLVAYSSVIHLLNMTAHSNTDAALYLWSDSVVSAERISIYNQTYGIITDDNVTANISLLSAYNSSFVLYDYKNSSLSIYSSLINDSDSNYTFVLDSDSASPSTLELINVTYNTSKVSLYSSSQIIRKWLLGVFVNDSSAPVWNASVSVQSSTSATTLSDLTNSLGYLEPLWNPVPVLIQNSSDNYSLNNQTIIIYRAGYVKQILSFNMTGNRWFNITLENQTGVLPNYSSFMGNTTDFTLEPDLTNVLDALLETPYGRVTFLGGNNFSGADLDSGLTISFGLVGLNSTGLPTLNVSARIELYNVSCQVSTIYYYPHYTKNRTLVLASGSDCESAGVCSSVNCSGSIIAFNSSHFSSFAVYDYANMTTWDASDSSSVFVYENITFYANYSTSSGSVDGSSGLSSCTIYFNSSSGTSSWDSGHSMSYSSSTELYTYTTSFPTPGTVFYNVSCNGTLYNASPSSLVSNATIMNDTSAPAITINNPENSTTLSYYTKTVVLNISTNETAECRYSTSQSSFSSSTPFSNTNLTTHTTSISVQNGTNYTFYYLCRDLNGNTNEEAVLHLFSVSAYPPSPAITIINPENSSSLAVGTTWTWLNITTNESASCRFSSNSSFDFSSSGTLMNSSASNTSHYYNYSGLSDGQNYTLYYKCNNSNGIVSSPKKHFFKVLPDTSAPDISFISPTPDSGSTVTSSSVNIKINISEYSNATLVINSSSYAMKNSSGGLAGTILNKSLTLSDGTYSYYVVAEDSAGNTAKSSSRTVTVDTTAPVITFVSPTNGSTLNDGGNILLSVSTDEAANCTLTSRKLGSTTSAESVALTASSSRKSFTKRFNSTADSNGFDNYFTVKCVDDYSHSNTSTVYFKLNDTTAPTVTFVYPTSSSYVASSSVTLNITTSEPLGSIKKAKVDSGSYATLSSGSGYYYHTFSSLNDSKHTITVNVSDTKGNTGTSSVSFTVDTKTPEMSVVSPENKEKIADCTSVLFNLTLSEQSDCSYEWYTDTEDDCRSGCKSEYEECYNDSDTVEEKESCRDTRDSCYDDCSDDKYDSFKDGSLKEQDRDACYSCQDSCESSCDSKYDSCMDSADTSSEEDDCKSDYNSCIDGCDSSCEDECKWYYYASWSECIDDGDYLVTFSCEDKAGNENVTNITFSVEDTVPPVITSISPSGKVHSYSVTLSATTSEDASCRYSDSNVPFSSMSGRMEGSSTSHSVSLTFTEPGTQTYYVACNDSNGNVMQSANSTTFEVVPTSNDYAYRKFDKLSPGTHSINFSNSSGVPVQEVTIQISAEVQNEIIEVEELPEKPSDVPAPSDKTYSYFELRRKSSSDVMDSATLTFTVSTSWIISQGVSASDIVLKHYLDSSDSWENLPTSKVSDGAEYLTYSATTSSFSLFAISVASSDSVKQQDSSSAPPQNSATESNVSSGNATAQQNGSIGPDTEQPSPEWPEIHDSGFSWLWTVVSIIGLMFAGGAVWVSFKGPFWRRSSGQVSDLSSRETPDPEQKLSGEEESLKSYLDSGMGVDDVKNLFVENGWSESDFDALYRSLLSKTSSGTSSAEASLETVTPSTRDVSVGEPAPDLGQFVKQSLKAGTPTHEIVQQLISAGWPEETILGEIRSLENQKESLKQFIQQQLSAGASKEEISKELVSRGWPSEEIDEILSRYS